MCYLGIDVHVSTTVFCLMDATGEVVEQGSIPTTVMALQDLVRRLRAVDELLVGQEVGTMSYLVHDAVTALGVPIKSFNAWHLRMVASSRKKTDRRDAYWLAKAWQTGMTPPSVYIPTGEVRQLRTLLSRRFSVVTERRRWVLRARSTLHAAGFKPSRTRRVPRLIELAVMTPEGVDAFVMDAPRLCERMDRHLSAELKTIEVTIHGTVKDNEDVKRLMTIPSIGEHTAAMLYAWIGDVNRFANARMLASYVGVVPSVRQSGTTLQLGGITKAGSPQLRSVLVQAAHVLMFRCGASLVEGLVLRATRQDAVRPEQAHSDANGARAGRIVDAGLNNDVSSEAVAGEVREDQVAIRHGPYMRGCRVDWPVLLPVRQHVPGCTGAIEHAWKDGEPLTGADGVTFTEQDESALISTRAKAVVHSQALTAIMEVKAKGQRARKVDDYPTVFEMLGSIAGQRVALHPRPGGAVRHGRLIFVLVDTRGRRHARRTLACVPRGRVAKRHINPSRTALLELPVARASAVARRLAGRRSARAYESHQAWSRTPRAASGAYSGEHLGQ